MGIRELNNYFEAYLRDERLGVWHLALLVAVTLLAVKQRRLNRVRVTRYKLMKLSHITTLPTYHKYFKELQELGYIRYRPSYHPGQHSEIDIIIQP